ncbi:MAG: leucine-rich repeat protein, partial [Bacteroidales bacterium]|nr:leucine-rich repeat protein [Bacteroidales bacterium]
TAWDKEDQIIVTLTSRKFGAQSAVLTYNGTSWSTAVSLSDLENESPAVSAIYAPCYEVTEDGVMKLKSGIQFGMTEYIPAKTSVDGLNVSISFKDVTRTYSRLRIASEAGQELTVVTTGFTPAGATSEATNDYTLTTDDNGNAFLYGLFAEKATVSVSNGNVEMGNYAFTNATEKCVSYALDAPWPYLTFTASAEQTMTIETYSTYLLDESMQYSVNGGEWVQLTDGTAITFGGDNGTLRLRGKSANGTAASSSSHAQISFGDDNVQVACSGDIRTLVDYENYATVSTANARFCSLFESCTSLTTAPELPAVALADFCYYYMFKGCKSLTTAPELPATTLAAWCYESMFEGCTSLTVAPGLPATTLANNCYKSMFNGCTSLTTVPQKLPAETLAGYCYSSMFNGCTSLTTAPELPATTLAECCYDAMFWDCTSLTTVPQKLPATTLADQCYNRMFSGCTNLTTAPELPATTLAKFCYRNMFNGCTNLTAAPELPATTLVNYCYYYMFSGCTNLSNITMLATDISADYCLENWVSGVASSGTFTKAAAMTSLPTGTSGIPEGWTVVNK